MQGCSIPLNPNINNIDTVYFNQLDHASVFIVVNHDLQQYKLASKPTEGHYWGARTFHINLGKTLTDAVYQQVKALAPDSKIGNKPAVDKYDVLVILQMKNFDFGVIDDGGAQNKMVLGLIGATLAAGDDIISHAKITISTELQVSGKNPMIIDVVGEGIYATGFYSCNEKTLEKAVEKAISDFAKNLTLQIEKVLNDQV
jgi:hypothetical protein